MKPLTWTTKEGKELRIKDMKYGHLVNTIKYLERNYTLDERPPIYFSLVREYTNRTKEPKIEQMFEEVRQNRLAALQRDTSWDDFEDMGSDWEIDPEMGCH